MFVYFQFNVIADTIELKEKRTNIKLISFDTTWNWTACLFLEHYKSLEMQNFNK